MLLNPSRFAPRKSTNCTGQLVNRSDMLYLVAGGVQESVRGLFLYQGLFPAAPLEIHIVCHASKERKKIK